MVIRYHSRSCPWNSFGQLEVRAFFWWFARCRARRRRSDRDIVTGLTFSSWGWVSRDLVLDLNVTNGYQDITFFNRADFNHDFHLITTFSVLGFERNNSHSLERLIRSVLLNSWPTFFRFGLVLETRPSGRVLLWRLWYFHRRRLTWTDRQLNRRDAFRLITELRPVFETNGYVSVLEMMMRTVNSWDLEHE